MARAFYSYEVADPDLDWLITNFLSQHPEFIPVDGGNLPIVLLPQNEEAWNGMVSDSEIIELTEKVEDGQP